MNRCVCCFSPATQVRGDYYHCDWCAGDYDTYWSYRDDGQRDIVAVELSGYLGVDPEYAMKEECKI